MSFYKSDNNGTRIIGRKRVVTPSCLEASPPSNPLKRHNSGVINLEESNHLESIPQDVLVRILCKVDHSDLKQLLLVSRLVHEATMVAKELHFAYITPQTKCNFTTCWSNEDIQNAPRQRKVAKSRLDEEKIRSLTVVLFESSDDD